MKTEPRTVQEFQEWRRLQAWGLYQRGWRQSDISEALGVTAAAVCQWIAEAHRGGRKALRALPPHGGPAKLTGAQKRLLPDFLWHGAEAYGFRGDVWTCARVANVIRREFGVTYHKHHVARLLKELGWTPQMPLTRALQRDDEVIRRWREEVWPQLKKKRGPSGER